jgi:transporter family protein
VIAAAFSGLSYITYYESLKHGKVSIVGTIAGAYAPWTVILALVFLGESMSATEGFGVALVVASMLLFTYSTGDESPRRTELLGIALAACSLFLWGTSAALAKGVISEIGNTSFIGVFAVVCPTIWVAFWLMTARGRLEMPKASRGLLEIALLFIALGGITMYLAIENGPVSIVMPVTNLYPIVTIVFAKVMLKERLTTLQAIALSMILLSILLFSI